MTNKKSEVNWDIPRKNINPKTKQPYKRGRNWTIVVYPESAPKNWETLIDQEPVAISPLHDKDVDPNGELKKPHWHIILSYQGNKSFQQIDEIARMLHAPIPERVNSLVGATRYLTHQDHPDKYQYSSADIRTFGGFDLEQCLALSTGDKRELLRDMISYIKENEIMHLVDFTEFCLSEKAPAGWWEILTERNTMFIKEFIKSNWQKYGQGNDWTKKEKRNG